MIGYLNASNTEIHIKKGILVKTLKMDVYLVQTLDLAIVRPCISPGI